MANEINDINNNTGKIEYKKIFEHLIKNKKFKESVLMKKGNRITIKGFEEIVGEVVGEILEEAKRGKISPFKYLGYDHTTYMNTLSTLDLEGSAKELLELKKYLKEKIENMLEGELKLKGLDENRRGTTDITFDYNFNEKEIKCKNVTLNKGEATKVPRLRLDTVEICINKQDLKKKLKLGVRNYCEENIEDEEDLEIELEKIDNECKEIKAIFNVLNDEALGRIRRTISGTYLSYLIKNLAKGDENKQLLEAYEKRFIRLEEYLKEIIENRSTKHLMSLDGKEINIAEILMKGDAFNSLPLIGDLNISLGESSNEKEKNFKFSIKLKLNGRVQREDTVDTVVEYYKRKVEKKDFHKKYLDEGRIRIIFLYFFLFYKLDEEEHNPVSTWENKILECLKKEGIDKLSECFIGAVKEDGVIAKRIEAMKSSLKKVLIYKSSSMQPLKENRTLALSKGILGDVDGGDSLFKEHEYNKQMLKYVSVLINGFSDKYLLSVPIEIKIKSTDVYEDSKTIVEKSKIKYELAGLESLKVLFVPLSERYKIEEGKDIVKTLEKMEKNNVILALQYKNRKFREQDRENPEYVLTSMIYLLLSYLLIDLILQKSKNEKKNIYVAMLRAHNSKDANDIDGEFIRDVSKILEHIFNNRYRAGSQGMKRENDSKSYVVNNAMCSLYSKIPKVIEFSRKFELKKMAIVIVTSASCNREKVTGDERHDRVIVGEIVKCVADDSGSVLCDPYKTFQGVYTKKAIYETPRILSDEISKIYEEGFKHIVYIAKAPYTSKLNLTKTEEESNNMYFMNESVIKMMMGDKGDLIIYPMFYENYHAIDYKKGMKDNIALYIDDANELNDEVLNNHRSISAVMNLYSGKTINKDEEKLYRKGIIYEVPYNFYKEISFNAKIMSNLVENSAIKKDITKYILALHYSRYEAHKDIFPKINPYENLMGERGVTKRAMYKVKDVKLNVNLLAFLSEAEKILNKEEK